MNQRAERDRPGSIRFRALGIGLVGLILAAAMAAVLGYQKMIRYPRRAASHVPNNAQWVVLVDVESVIAFEPVRQALLPLLDRVGSTHRLRRLRQRADINVAHDLREILVAGSPGHWVVVLGGLFVDQPLVDPIWDEVVQFEQWANWSRQDGVIVQNTAGGLATGMAMAQASDGVWILADSMDQLQRALPRSDRAAELGLPESGDLRAVIHAHAPDSSIDAKGEQWAEFWRLPGIAPATVLKLGIFAEQQFRIEADLEASPAGNTHQWASDWSQPRSDAWKRLLPVTEWGGERAILLRRKVSAGDSGVHLTSRWSRQEAQRAAYSLAAWLERWHASEHKLR